MTSSLIVVPTLADLLGQLDPDPVRRGRQFELIAKWFLENDPVQNAQFRRIWRWDDWPGAWGAETGIDLVAQRKDRSLVAIQVKCYRSDRLVTKQDLDKFLSESSRAVFAERLLIATCDIGRNARRTVEGQEKPVHTLLLSDLEHSAVDWPSSPDRLRAWRPKPKRPQPHQTEAIRHVVEGLKTADRGQLIMACGTGKTLIGLWVAEKIDARRTLVLVPSLSLLSQTVREWKANDRRGFEFIAVCSDDTVVGEDAMVSRTAYLPFTSVTTKPAQIAGFLRRHGPLVVFSTYQSSPKVAEAQTFRGVPKFDFALADEAHRCAGKVDPAFGTILDSAAIRADKRVFTTATPRVASGRLKRAARDADLDIVSMDDDHLFGRVLHDLSFGEAIARDLLSDYQVSIVIVNNQPVQDLIDRRKFVDWPSGPSTDARTLGAQIGLAKAVRRFGLSKVVTFHSRVNLAAGFAHSFPALVRWIPRSTRPHGPLWCEHVSGAMPGGQRDRLLRQLGHGEDKGVALLANARCLNEGVDVPTLDGVAFIDPRRSQIDIVQAVGRAIRKAADKKLGTVVLPVFVPSDSPDVEDVVASSSFATVVKVLRALRDHDETLRDELDGLRVELGRRGSIDRLPPKVEVIGATRISQAFVRALQPRIVELTTVSWEFWFGLLEKYVEHHGHTRVPVSYRIDGYRLGQWVHNQRRRRRTLDADHQHRLEALPGWTWDQYADWWEEGFSRLLEYVERTGDARVPSSYVLDGYKLGYWVNSQRNDYTDGTLKSDRQRRLDSVPGWSWNTLTDQWEEGFSRLQDYIERYGHARVPHSYSIDGYRLGGWVSKQRDCNAKGSLDAERQRRLQNLPGWKWDPFVDQWEEGFSCLVEYVEHHGDARVPVSYKVDGYKLGQWVSVQRHKHAKGIIDHDRERRLQNLPGWTWDPFVDQWEEGFSRLIEYIEHHGDARVPMSCTVGGYQLGMWARTQRANHSEGTLEADRECRLQNVPGWTWGPKADLWEEGFDQLKAYVKRNGHARVPASYAFNGYKLGHWVNNQRVKHDKGILDADRERRLEEVRGWTWYARADIWEESFNHLLRYVERHGHARVPASYTVDGYRVGAWVSMQRYRHRKGILNADRERRLQDLPGWTWKASSS